MRAAHALGLMLAVLTLASCGDIPQPFRHEGAPTDLARPKMTRAVTIRPLQDSTDGPALATALVQALEEQDIPAHITDGPAFGHVITGEMQATGKAVTVRWTLKAPDGTTATTATQTVPTPLLAQGEPVLLKRAAMAAATALAGPLADPDGQAKLPVPALVDNRSVVSLLPLKGLPGDGDKALFEAMKRALGRGGLVVRDDAADYVVEGKVTVAPGLPGEETLSVAWIVRRAKDKADLGNIGQSGAVPKGRLAQGWGTLARDIAEGGATGVVEVVLADTRGGKRKNL